MTDTSHEMKPTKLPPPEFWERRNSKQYFVLSKVYQSLELGKPSNLGAYLKDEVSRRGKEGVRCITALGLLRLAAKSESKVATNFLSHITSEIDFERLEDLGITYRSHSSLSVEALKNMTVEQLTSSKHSLDLQLFIYQSRRRDEAVAETLKRLSKLEAQEKTLLIQVGQQKGRALQEQELMERCKRLNCQATVDQEEYKWSRQLRESIPGCVLDPGDFHFLLNVLKAFAKIYCPAGFSWSCVELGVETTDVDLVKVFSKILDLFHHFFYAAVLSYKDRFSKEKKEKEMDFDVWLITLKETHLNHRFWIPFIFEFLPTFFALRRFIREGADEDYNIRSLAWCSLSRLFLFTNKTNYLQVYVDFRIDEVERSEMETATVKSGYHTGRKGHASKR
jgi:hypothetical protein